MQPTTAAEVIETRFPTTRFAEGYEMAEVDELLDRCAQALIVHERGPGAHRKELAHWRALADDASLPDGQREIAARAFAETERRGPGPHVVAADLAHAGFGVTRFRLGYAQDAVDDLLARVQAALAAHEARAR